MSYYGNGRGDDSNRRPYDNRRGTERGGRGYGGNEHGGRYGGDSGGQRGDFRGGRPSHFDQHDRSRSRGHGGERQQRVTWEREGIEVMANFYRLTSKVAGKQTWYRYHIQINNCKKQPFRDREGNVVKDEDGKTVFDFAIGRSIFDDRDLSGDTVEENKKKERRNRASHISRRVICALERELGLPIVSDGSAQAISSQPLDGLTTEEDKRKKLKNDKKPDTGVYGPADPGGSAPAPELSPIIKPWKVFPPIRVRRDCDDDDPEAYLSKYSWYQVKVSEAGTVDFTVDQRGRFAEFDGEDAGPFCQSINLAVNNAMLGRMLALEKAPKLLYFANIEDISPRMLPDWQPRHHHPEDRMPLFGLLQNTRVTADGMCCLIVVLGLGWKRPDSYPGGGPIPILRPLDEEAFLP